MPKWRYSTALRPYKFGWSLRPLSSPFNMSTRAKKQKDSSKGKKKEGNGLCCKCKGTFKEDDNMVLICENCEESMIWVSEWVLSKFNGTSTPKGHTVPKQVITVQRQFKSLQPKHCTVWEHSLSGHVWTKSWYPGCATGRLLSAPLHDMCLNMPLPVPTHKSWSGICVWLLQKCQIPHLEILTFRDSD